MKSIRPILAVVLLLSISVIFGCGPKRAERPDRSRVTGKITYSGQPVQGGIITFLSTSGSGDSAGGMIKADGTYSVADVPMGENQVTIDTEALRPELGSRYVKLPEKYLTAEESGLTLNVEAGENSKDFVLED